MNVSELAKRVGVTPGVVRYYTRLGLLQVDKLSNGYHNYSLNDLRDMRFIAKAKTLGFTLNEIKTILSHAKNGQSPCQEVRSRLAQRLEENQEKIQILLELQSRMEKAMASWSGIPDGMPDHECICVLIESFDCSMT